LRSALGALLLLLALGAQAQMYKCIDERGRTRYTDKPAPDCKETAISTSPPIAGQLKPPPENLPREDADLKRRLIEYEQSAAKDRQDRIDLAARCARLRAEQGMLQNSSRIATTNAKGEREFIDDATRERRLAALAQELRACP